MFLCTESMFLRLLAVRFKPAAAAFEVSSLWLLKPSVDAVIYLANYAADMFVAGRQFSREGDLRMGKLAPWVVLRKKPLRGDS